MKRKTVVVAAVVLAAALAFAQDAELVKVRGKGTGADRAEALKDAYRDAVERAVGLYVDAEQMLKNEELVKDQILTQSNAYIEKYDVAKETTKPNGLFEVQILAEVRKAALTKKISDVMPAKRFRLGGNLKNVHAKMVSTAKRGTDGAALLKKAIEGFYPFPLVVDCTLASPDAVVRELTHPRDPKNMIAVNYLFRTEINQRRYSEIVVPRLKDVLAQISLAEPREVTIAIRPDDIVNVDSLVAAGKKSPYYLANKGGGNTADDRLKYDLDGILGPPRSEDAKLRFVLVTGGNKSRTAYKGIVYELDEESARLVDWRNWKDCGRGNGGWGEGPRFTATLLDKDDNPIHSETFKPQWYSQGASCIHHMGEADHRPVVVVAPWRSHNGKIQFEYYTWHEFVIPKDALPEVQDMKIELAK